MAIQEIKPGLSGMARKEKMTVDVDKLVKAGIGIKTQEVDLELGILSNVVRSKPELVIARNKKNTSQQYVREIDVYNVIFPDGSANTLDRAERYISDRGKLSKGRSVESVGEQIAILSHEHGVNPKAIELTSWTATDGEKGDVDNNGIKKRYDLRYPDVLKVLEDYLRNLNPEHEKKSLQEIGEILKQKSGFAQKGEIYNAK